MSYEGDLVANYNHVHKRLLGSPPIEKDYHPAVRHHPTDKNSLQAILLRLEAIEQSIADLNKVLIKSEIKLEGAKEAICSTYPQPRLLSVENILELVCRREAIAKSDVVGPRRQAEIVQARHFAYYLAAKWTKRTYTQIGLHLGGRDHSTVFKGISRLERKRKAHPQIDSQLFWYESELKKLTNPVNNGDKPSSP